MPIEKRHLQGGITGEGWVFVLTPEERKELGLPEEAASQEYFIDLDKEPTVLNSEGVYRFKTGEPGKRGEKSFSSFQAREAFEAKLTSCMSHEEAVKVVDNTYRLLRAFAETDPDFDKKRKKVLKHNRDCCIMFGLAVLGSATVGTVAATGIIK